MPRCRSSASESVWVLPSIDAADLVDDTGGEEQPLGQACLTGVYMRQDPQVQRSAASVIPSE